MIEIMAWDNPGEDFKRLKVNPKCTWIGLNNLGNVIRVYEVNGIEFKIMCEDTEPEGSWQNGCWRSADGSNLGKVSKRYKIANHYIKAWDGAGRIAALEEVNGNTNHDDYWYQNREYGNLLEYISEEIGAGQPRNVCAVATDLAKQNGIKLSELFAKYQPL